MSLPEDDRLIPRPTPTFIAGLLLNLVLPGAGFTFIGRWGWHLAWIGILCGLYLLAWAVSAVTASPLGLLVPFLGFLAQLIHYPRVYARQQLRDFQPPLAAGAKLALILGQVVVGLILGGILAAALLPSLQVARPGAREQGQEQDIARAVQGLIVAQDLGGTLRDGPCELTALPAAERARITACSVGSRAPEGPAIHLTFTSGRTIRRP